VGTLTNVAETVSSLSVYRLLLVYNAGAAMRAVGIYPCQTCQANSRLDQPSGRCSQAAWASTAQDVGCSSVAASKAFTDLCSTLDSATGSLLAV
jgi:hypothetical protein